MKRVISLLTLLLLGPAFASAACLPSQVCLITSGTAVVDPNPNPPCPGGFGPCASFNFAGRDFSASGVIPSLEPFGLPFDTDLFIPGGSFSLDVLGNAPPNGGLQFELTVNGVPWGNNPGDAFAHFFATLDLCCVGLSSAGHVSPFSFEGGFTGAPGLGCNVLNCVTLEFRGSGIVTYDVTDGAVADPLTFRFEAVPEPATLSLFAVGLVGLAMRRKAVAALLCHS